MHEPYLTLVLGIGTGNPGVFQGYPHLHPRKPVPVPRGTGTGTGFAKTRGYATRERVCLQNRLRNLATAVQVSIDTAVQHCEVSSSVVAGWHDPSGHLVPRSWALIIGVLVGRTRLAWLREYSRGGGGVEGLRVVIGVLVG